MLDALALLWSDVPRVILPDTFKAIHSADSAIRQLMVEVALLEQDCWHALGRWHEFVQVAAH